jgi:hypothetical protein
MSSISASTTGGGSALGGSRGILGSVFNTAAGMATAKLSQKVAAWTDKLNGVGGENGASQGVPSVAQAGLDAGLDALAESGGAAQSAGAEGVKASLHGKNPVWGAVKGAWESGTPVIRAVIITAGVGAVVLLLVSPVLLVVFLLSLLIVSAFPRAEKDKDETHADADSNDQKS